MIFTIKVNGTQFLVEKDTVSEAICCAVETYVAAISDSPDQCTLNTDTMPMSIQTCGVTDSVVDCVVEAP